MAVPKVVIMVMFMVGLATINGIMCQTNPSQCKDERKQLQNTCLPVIFGQNASPNCCQNVRAMHYECVCPYVTPKLVALMKSVDRVIQQIKACGRTVPHNFKCGSITTP